MCRVSDLGHCSHRWGWSPSTAWRAWSPGRCEWSSAGWTTPRCRRRWSQRWWVIAGSQTSYFGIWGMSMCVWVATGDKHSWRKQQYICIMKGQHAKGSQMMFSYDQSGHSSYCSRGRYLVLIQMAVIKTIKCRKIWMGVGRVSHQWATYHSSALRETTESWTNTDEGSRTGGTQKYCKLRTWRNKKRHEILKRREIKVKLCY